MFVSRVEFNTKDTKDTKVLDVGIGWSNYERL
jgi:hypothetical protein